MTCTYKRLPGGDWGIFSLHTDSVASGDTVTVQKRSGERKTETIGKLVKTDTYGSYWTIETKSQTKETNTMRTPSMSELEARTAIGFERGTLTEVAVDTPRRANLRKWFSARGVPSAINGAYTVAMLVGAYNSETVYQSLVNASSEKEESAQQTNGHDSTETATQTNGHDTVETAVVVPPTPVIPNDVAQAFELLKKLFGNSVNEQQVKGIVAATIKKEIADAIASVQRIVTVEIKPFDAASYKVDGHCHPKLADLIKAMSARMSDGKHPNIMLKGPTGSGKTYSVWQAAKALGLEFYTNGAISQDYQLIGYRDAAGNYHETELRKAFGKAAVYLFDEIDASQNSPLLCLAGALANHGFAFPDAFVTRHPDSIIIAAGNTWGNSPTAEFVGRNKLDGAIRSRFPVRINWPVDETLERAIAGNVQWVERVQRARHAADAAGMKVTIDPRMSQAGAALIAAGFTAEQAAQYTYLADLTSEQRSMVDK